MDRLAVEFAGNDLPTKLNVFFTTDLLRAVFDYQNVYFMAAGNTVQHFKQAIADGQIDGFEEKISAKPEYGDILGSVNCIAALFILHRCPCCHIQPLGFEMFVVGVIFVSRIEQRFAPR
jgi:hypothetical protein